MQRDILTESYVVVALKEGETETTLCLPITHFRVQKRNIELSWIFASENYKGGRQNRHSQKDSWVPRTHGPSAISSRAFMKVAVHVIFLKTLCQVAQDLYLFALIQQGESKREDPVRT